MSENIINQALIEGRPFLDTRDVFASAATLEEDATLPVCSDIIDLPALSVESEPACDESSDILPSLPLSKASVLERWRQWTQKKRIEGHTALDQAMDRREFLQKFGLGIVATGLVAQYGAVAETIAQLGDQVSRAEDKLWPDNKPSFNLMNGKVHSSQTELGIFFPGFGDIHAEKEANLWTATSELPDDMLTGYLDYSHHGATIEDMVKLIKQSVDLRKIESLTLFGRSMGGEFEIAVAAELGIPVKSMILCSSPFSLRDGDFGNVGELIAHLPKDRAIATAAKFFVNTGRAWRKNGDDLSKNMAEGWQATMSGESSEALQEEVIVDHAIDLEDPAMIQKLRKIFIPGYSEVVYVATDKPSTDQTVMVLAAAKKYRRLFQHKLNVNFQVMGLPYEGHANIKATTMDKQVKQWVKRSTAPRILASK